MDYNLPIEKIGDGIASIKNSRICEVDFQLLFYYFLLPILCMLVLILLLKYREVIKTLILRIYSKTGHIRIYFRLPNKRIKNKLIKLDKFNNFKIGQRKFNLEKMYDFIYGYDKYNFPIFLYDYQFILPLKISVEKVTDEIKKNLGADNLSDDEISAITMKIDSSILKTVYDKKLISDLYSISGDNSFKKTIFWVIIGMVGIGLLYYTGYLEVILGYFT